MVYGVILAGGRGERFWPLSRAACAKQFLPLAGDKSLISATQERIAPLIAPERLFVVTAQDQQPLVLKHLPLVPPPRVLVEPVGRNTAPAVALAAARAGREDTNATLVVLPSDTWVGNDSEYRSAIETAIRAAEAHDAMVTVGVAPTRPETGYGYLEIGEPLGALEGVHRVRRFVEKPSEELALTYLTGGRHLWNCGIFVMRVAVFREALEKLLPEVAIPLGALEKDEAPDREALQSYYAAVPSVSIDYGIMEKAENVATVKGAFPWDDLGSWLALERILPADGEGVTRRGEVHAVDCSGSIIYSEDGLIAALGVPNLVIVRTRDATLVLPKERAQDVRRLVRGLSEGASGRKFL